MKVKHKKFLIKLIISKSKKICKTLKSTPKTRGRPKLYPDYIIVAALLIKTLEKLSLRDLEEKLKDLLPKVPDFTTIHYRFKKLNQDYLKDMIEQTAKEIMKQLKAKELYCLIADGTGFGYAQTYNLTWKRGKKLREVNSHIKTEILVGVVKNKSIVLSVNTDKAYADENRLLREMLSKLDIRSKYFLGDSYYGKSVETLKIIKEKGMKAIIPVRDTFRMKVRDSYRVWAKDNYENNRDIYRRNRYKVEQVIGIVKNRFGDRDRTKDFYIGSLYVLGRFALYNLMLLVSILLLCFYAFDYMLSIRCLFYKLFRFFQQAQLHLTNIRFRYILYTMETKKLDTNKHSVFLLYYHLVLVVKYRKDVIDDKISKRLREIFEYIQPNYKITLIEWNHDKDHIHVLFKATPTTPLSKFINTYKSASSRLIKKEFPEIRRKLWKEYFWSRSYCLLTTGGVSIDIVKRYIENQGIERHAKSL